MECRVVASAIGIVLILLTSLPMVLDTPLQRNLNASPVIEQVDNTVISYTPHSAIQTNGDTELHDLAITDDWPGYGNSTHPYIIEGYSITALTPIQIGYTSYIFTIRDCLITGTDSNSGYGIRILGTDYTSIENCIISNAQEGIEFYDVQNSTISNCTTYNCGIYGMYMMYSFYCNIYGSTVRDNDDMGIHVRNSHHMTIENTTLYGNRFSDIIVDHEASWNSDYLNLVNITIRGMHHQSGLHIIDTNFVTATSMTIYDSGIGVFIEYSHGFSLSQSHIFENGDYGVILGSCTNLILNNNHIHDHIRSGVLVYGCNSSIIEMNEICSNGLNGIEVEKSLTCDIFNNTIYDNDQFGVWVNFSDSGTLESNTIRFNSDSGFYLGFSDNWTVNGNLVHDNVGYGFELYETNKSLLYYNDIGWNSLSNANDTGSGSNYWNSIYTGNWWHDYTGGVYNISGGATDNFPSYNLVGENNGPLAVQWERVDSQLVWYANALNPVSYEVHRNGSFVESNSWDGSNIVVDVNTTALGYYEYTIIAHHISGHNTSRTASVMIGDWCSPSWVFTPQDVILLVGVDLFYQLVANDQSALGGWDVNDTVNFAVSDSGLITNNVPLDVGVYGLNVSVYDTLSNTRFIVIRIIVIGEIPVTTTTPAPTTSPTITPADDSSPLIISGLLGAFGGAFLVTVIVLISRRRGGTPG